MKLKLTPVLLLSQCRETKVRVVMMQEDGAFYATSPKALPVTTKCHVKPRGDTRHLSPPLTPPPHLAFSTQGLALPHLFSITFLRYTFSVPTFYVGQCQDRECDGRGHESEGGR